MRSSSRRNKKDVAAPHLAPGDLRVVQAFLATEDRSTGTDTLSHPSALSEWMCRHALLDAGGGFGGGGVTQLLQVQQFAFTRQGVRGAAGGMVCSGEACARGWSCVT